MHIYRQCWEPRHKQILDRLRSGQGRGSRGRHLSLLPCTSDKLMDFPELQCTFLWEGFRSPPSRDGWTEHMGHNSVRSPEGMFIVKNISPKVFVYKHIMVTQSTSKSKTSVEGCFQVWQS